MEKRRGCSNATAQRVTIYSARSGDTGRLLLTKSDDNENIAAGEISLLREMLDLTRGIIEACNRILFFSIYESEEMPKEEKDDGTEAGIE